VPSLPQTEVFGTTQRTLATDERLWIVVVPRQGNPWVAGWTRKIEEGGRWRAVVTQLWQEEKPVLFDLLALPSTEDPRQKDRKAMLEWIYESRDFARPVKVRIVNGPAR